MKKLTIQKSKIALRKGPIGVSEISSLRKSEDISPKQQQLFIIFVFVALLVSFSFLLISGFSLTIANGKRYAELSANNSLRQEPIFGERGLILDRNGNSLVINKKSYDIFIDPTKIIKEDALKIIPSEAEKIEKMYSSKFLSITRVVHDAKKEDVFKLRENPQKGISVRESISREYPSAYQFAHLLGYTGVASESDLQNPSYIQNQIVGKSGIEYEYDADLQGKIVYDTVEVDSMGNPVDHFVAEKPAGGNSLILSVDKAYQEKMYELLKKTVDNNKARGGSAVLMNVNTGEIVALASYPAFDPNEFVKGISQKSYEKLINSPQTPLLNRPIAAQEPPGSTFKTIVAVAALESGAITPQTTHYASGVITLAGGQPFQDYRKRVYGTLNVRDALMVSSNIFFCRTIMELSIEKLLPYADAFGIGKKTGIDLPGEMSGRIPSPENKIALSKAGAYWLDPVWYPEGDSCNSAIGQGIALATPLQITVVASAIANNGTIYKPTLVKKIIAPDGNENIKTPTALVTNIASQQTLQIVREGMRMGVNGPRAIITSLNNLPVSVAAKTGTAEFGIKDKNGYLTTHAWVMGFYPYEEPQYAFTIMIEGGGTSTVASTMMREFLQSVQ